MSGRKLIPFAPLVAAAMLALWLWPMGGIGQVTQWAAEGQRSAQNALAGALRALRQGDPAALATLLGVCFLYGVFHAAGPGHGKVLIGGYGFGRPVAALRLAGLALASSLAQSLSAVLLVLAGIGLLGHSRGQVTGLADGALNILSYAAIGLIGLWLVIRGMRGLLASRHVHHHHNHDHVCDHAHAPTAEQAAQVGSLRDALALIGAVAIRPCTGALFLLIVAWRMEIMAAGIAGTFAMGLGTATVTIAAALAAVWLRQSSLDRVRAAMPDATRAARLAALAEIAGGALIAAVALSVALRLTLAG